MVGIRAWFRVAILIGRLWIPAFAGMTAGARKGGVGWDSGLVSGGCLVPAFARMTLLGDSGFPPSRE